MPNLQPTVDFLQGLNSAVLLTHERPDGDAIGSIAGLAHYLQATGRHVELWFYVPPPDRYAPMLKDLLWRTLEPGVTPTPARPDASWILCDTCTYNQISPIAEAVKARGGVDWVVDHHLTRDPLFKNGLIDETASATGLLIYELVRKAGWKPHIAAAEALFTAICTDTGWFRFSNSDGRTYRAGAGLIEAGVQPADLYDKLFQNDSPARISLVVEALSGLEMLEDGKVAVLTLTQASFAKAKATSSDTENLTDEAGRLRGVNVVVLLVEMPDGKVRCSLRSKRAVDVNLIAQKFGGGGHARAAGARPPGAIADVKKALLAAVVEAVRAAG